MALFPEKVKARKMERFNTLFNSSLRDASPASAESKNRKADDRPVEPDDESEELSRMGKGVNNTVSRTDNTSMADRTPGSGGSVSTAQRNAAAKDPALEEAANLTDQRAGGTDQSDKDAANKQKAGTPTIPNSPRSVRSAQAERPTSAIEAEREPTGNLVERPPEERGIGADILDGVFDSVGDSIMSDGGRDELDPNRPKAAPARADDAPPSAAEIYASPEKFPLAYAYYKAKKGTEGFDLAKLGWYALRDELGRSTLTQPGLERAEIDTSRSKK